MDNLKYLLITLPIALLSSSPILAQINSRLAQEHFESGENSYNQGQYEVALDHINKSLQLNPGLFEAYLLKARINEKQNNWNGAVTQYSIFLDRFPEDREVLLSRGLARLQAMQYQASIEDFRKVLSLKSNMETGIILYRQNKTEGGTDKILSVQGEIKDFLYSNIGMAYLKAAQYDSAITYFDSAIYVNNSELDYYLHRGLSRQGMKDLKGAQEDYQKVLDIDPSHSLAHHNIGVLMRDLNSDQEEVEKKLTESIANNPRIPYSYMERAYLRTTTGNLSGAIQDYDSAILLDPSNAEIWVNRGLAKEQQLDLKGAYNDFSKAIEIEPGYEKAWFCRATVLVKQNELIKAIEDYTVAILYYPSYASAFYNRALVYQRLGKNYEACQDIVKAEELGIQINSRLKKIACDSSE